MQLHSTMSNTIDTVEKQPVDTLLVDLSSNVRDVASIPATPTSESPPQHVVKGHGQCHAPENRQSGFKQSNERGTGEHAILGGESDTSRNRNPPINDGMADEFGEAEAGEVIEDRVAPQSKSMKIATLNITNARDGRKHHEGTIGEMETIADRTRSHKQSRRSDILGNHDKNDISIKSSQQEPKKVRRYEQCKIAKAPVGLFACFSASSSTQNKAPQLTPPPTQEDAVVEGPFRAPQYSGPGRKSPQPAGLFNANQNGTNVLHSSNAALALSSVTFPGHLATPSVSTPSKQDGPPASLIFNRPAENESSGAPPNQSRGPRRRSRTPPRTHHSQDTCRRSPKGRNLTESHGPPDFDRLNGQRRSPQRRSRSRERDAGHPPFIASRPRFNASRSREPETFRRSRSRGPPQKPVDRFHEECRMDRPVMHHQRSRSRSRSRGPSRQYPRDAMRSPSRMRETSDMSSGYFGHRGAEGHPFAGRMPSARSPRSDQLGGSPYRDIPSGDRRWRSPPNPRMNPSMSNNEQHNTISPNFSASADAPTRKLFVTHQGDWNFELRRSSRSRCRCRAVAVTLPSPVQLPSFIDIIQLPHLSRYHEFLMSDRRDIKRIVYEVAPNTMADKVGYEEFVTYLLRGKNGISRAGVAMDLEQVGYKLFVLPPGQAARSLGYKGNNLIAVLRKKQQ